MTKTEAKAIFNGNGAELGRAIGVLRARVSQWPEELDQATTDRVIGAAVRLGLTEKLPERFKTEQITPSAATAQP